MSKKVYNASAYCTLKDHQETLKRHCGELFLTEYEIYTHYRPDWHGERGGLAFR